MITLTPNKELVFNVSELERQKTVSVSLKIDNTTSERVLFKIKTTKPQNYHVKPNSGIITPKGTVTIQVALLEAAVQQAPDARSKEDKFLVQTILESECEEPLPAVIDPAAEATLVKERWAAVETVIKSNKDGGPSITKNKLTCRLVRNNDEAQPAAPAAAAAAATTTAAAAPKAAPASSSTSSGVSSASAPKVSASLTRSAADAAVSTKASSSNVSKTKSSTSAASIGDSKGSEDHTMPSIILLFVVFLLGVIMGKFVL